jgi:peptidoglycan/xylan/chitin deacetylase (PgdA/CDA1 family)
VTTDDGPYFYTEALLDTLEAYNFKATFFVTGINNGKGSIDSTSTDWPRLLQRMITDGHQVASHTWSHLDLSTLTAAQQETEMVKNEMAFRNVLGKFPTYMRPPYSSCNALCLQTLARLGYHVTYFDLDTQDYLHTTPETNQISKDVVEDYLTNRSPATQNYLSIAHDLHWQTVHNLTIFMFDEMVRLGWRGTCFFTVDKSD